MRVEYTVMKFIEEVDIVSLINITNLFKDGI